MTTEIPVLLGFIPMVGKLFNLWWLTFLPAATKERLALHDIVCKTQVIKVKHS